MTLVEVRDLTKRFGDVVAVDSLTLEVAEGTIHGVVGPNGAGKTTALQSIIGLLTPTSGEAFVGGDPAGSLAAKERIGYSPQELTLDDSMTGRQYLIFMGRVAGMDKGAAADRADELIDWLDLSDAADRRVGDYSGGMKRRIGLAQAMIHEPELLILDEPTTGLDPTGRQKIMNSLSSLPDDGITVMVSSHVLSELEQYIDSVTILQDGRLVMTDTVEAVQDAYGGQAFSVKTGDNERVKTLLDEHDLVQSVEAEKGKLIVMTEEPDDFRQDLQQLLVEEGISLKSLSEEGTLQEAFADIVATNDAESDAREVTEP